MNELDFTDAPVKVNRRRREKKNNTGIVLSVVGFVVLCFGGYLAWDFYTQNEQMKEVQQQRIQTQKELDKAKESYQREKKAYDKMMREKQ